MSVLHLDYETFCELNLKKTGAHRYARHESTDIICAAWAFDAEEPALWLPGEPVPERIVDHILDGGMIEAWNAEFERLITWHVACRRYGWPMPARQQFRCPMTAALAMGMPAALEAAAPAFGLNIAKDAHGNRTMLQLCKPRKPTKKRPQTRFVKGLYYEWDEKFRTVYEYCLQDVRVEQAISERVVHLKGQEQERYWLAGEINDRGIPIDLPLIQKAQKIVEQHLAKLDRQMAEVTGDEVQKCSQTKELVAWLGRNGLRWPDDELPSVAKDPIARLLARDDLTNSQRVALELRREAAKTSTAKLDAFEGHMSADETVKGSLQFNGASTGRDAARGVQAQNFPRPNKKTNLKALIEDILNGADNDYIEVCYGPPMSVIADMLRSCIKVPRGKKFYSCDLSQIEARMTAYLAGEEKVLEAFRRYDRKEGPDIYTIAAAGIYNVAPHLIGKESDERQAGKVSVLALGFGGGVGAFASMAKIYQLDLRKAYPPVWGLASAERRDKVLEAWKLRGKQSGMAREAFLASDLIKLAWRADNPNICQSWKDAENAAVVAINNPGKTYRAGLLKFRKTGSFLRMILPSGRSLFFPYARVEYEKNQWGYDKPVIYIRAVDPLTRRFREYKLWGGTIIQNAVQAASRDVMWDAVERLEAAGYPNIFRVHDEVINMTDEGFGDMEEFRRLFVESPAWAPDLPVSGEGWEGERYRK